MFLSLIAQSPVSYVRCGVCLECHQRLYQGRRDDRKKHFFSYATVVRD
jgi:hypothetical protein